MRKYVLLLSVVSSACSPGSEGTGEDVDLDATGTTFDCAPSKAWRRRKQGSRNLQYDPVQVAHT